MTGRWWGLDTVPVRRTPDRADAATAFPSLVDATGQAVRAELKARLGGFTPDWQATPGDPGVVLVKAFAEQLAPLRRRLNLLPEAHLRSLLDIGGLGPRAASPARTTVVFAIADNASEAVLAPARLRLSVPPVGEGDPVIFETLRGISITAARLGDVLVQVGNAYSRRDPATIGPGSPLAAFGAPPQPGGALWVGLTAEGVIGRSLDLGFRVAAYGSSGRVARGGWDERDPATAVLAWDAILPSGPRPLAVPVDATASLAQTGVIQLDLPAEWQPTPAPGSLAGPARRWLRARLVQPGARQPPLVGIDLNAVEAEATETVRDEPLEPVGNGDGGSRSFRLRRTPVVAGSVRIEVDAPVEADVFGVDTPSPTAPGSREWEPVESLSEAGPTAHVFTVDAASGVLRFGDGAHGAAVPTGFRNVRATGYRAGGGPEGNVPADSSLTPQDTIPFLTSATNPVAASGGANAEEQPRLLATGPRTLRCRRRAVTAVDYEALALAAPVAALGQARAFSGVDVDGTPRPGQVTLVVVAAPPDPPQPNDGVLDAVARHLVVHAMPAGIRLVVRAPRLVAMRVEADVTIDAGADQGTVLREASDRLDRLLDPSGTESAVGWPLGKTVAHRAVVNRLAAVDGISGVRRLMLTREGRRIGRCADAPLPPDGLPDPRPHLLLPVEVEAGR
jgi:predicted phage baseplate assembly protein